MTLSPGQKLGPYEIESAAGAGGMGEVYRAKDTRLDRTVAIKIMPTATADNPDLRARFEREAKAISGLNHPNICTLYDVGHDGGVDYLVMEFLEGQTLDERIKQGPVDFTEALDIAIQIADALDKAHRQGLIHRDLKPANVILTKEGAKLLDFGLAKLQTEGGVVEGISGITQTTPLTGAGTIVGTIQYMSPEQLEGSEADARSDIFAFGALLYELITGSRAFSGKSQASLIASILKEQPRAVSDIKPMSPPALDRLIKKCLAKDPDDRWQSAKDLSDELRWIADSGSQAGIPAAASSRRRFRFRLGWGIAALAIVVAGVYAFMWYSRPEPDRKLIRFTIDPGPGLSSITWPQISPDGRYLAFKGVDTADRQERIWIRPLNSNEAFPLNGTEGALRPFWSPDSRYLAYTANQNQLKKVPINGGPPQLIGEFPAAADGAWGAKGTILFDGSLRDSIRAVSAGGGVASAATTLDHENGQRFHAWPEFLPDGDHFLFLSSTDTSFRDATSYMLQIGSLSSGETRELFPVISKVEYCQPGYLLYVRDKVLLAQAFDADALEVIGEPIPVAENIAGPATSPISYFDVSDEGTLVYLTSDASARNELVWVDRSGRELDRIGEPSRYGDVALSPDGRRLIYALEDPQSETMDLWMYDIRRNVSSRFTFQEGNEFFPLWSRDERQIIYNGGVLPNITPYTKPSNGTGQAEPLFEKSSPLTVVTDVSRDGTRAYITTLLDNSPAIVVKDLTSDAPPEVLINTPQDEFLGRVSPDGRYLAYLSNDGDQPELYIQSLDEFGGKWQVSTAGAQSFIWNASGDEIVYVTQGGDFMSVAIERGESFDIGTPTKLFNKPSSMIGFSIRGFDMTADGQKFLIVTGTQKGDEPMFSVILNWQEILRER